MNVGTSVQWCSHHIKDIGHFTTPKSTPVPLCDQSASTLTPSPWQSLSCFLSPCFCHFYVKRNQLKQSFCIQLPSQHRHSLGGTRLLPSSSYCMEAPQFTYSFVFLFVSFLNLTLFNVYFVNGLESLIKYNGYLLVKWNTPICSKQLQKRENISMIFFCFE